MFLYIFIISKQLFQTRSKGVFLKTAFGQHLGCRGRATLNSRIPFDIQYTMGPKQSFDEMVYAKNVERFWRGANKRSKVNALVFLIPTTTVSPTDSKKSMFILTARDLNTNYEI